MTTAPALVAGDCPFREQGRLAQAAMPAVCEAALLPLDAGRSRPEATVI